MSFPTGWQLANLDGESISPALHIGELPGRKRIALYVVDGGALTPLAYFRDREAAETAWALIERIGNAYPYPSQSRR